MEREKFEESLKQAFDKAEVSPSDQVWTNIELDLERAKGGDLKRRLMFYQMLAAASIVFALTIGGVGYYYNVTRQDHRLAVQNIESREVTPDEAEVNSRQQPDANTAITTPGTAITTPADTQEQRDASTEPEASALESDQPQVARVGTTTGIADATDRTDEMTERGQALAGTNEPGLPGTLEVRALPPLYTPEKIEAPLLSTRDQVDPVVAMLARLDQREKEVSGEKEEKNTSGSNENLWTSIGFAAGSFNSIATSASSPRSPGGYNTMSLAAPIVDQETNASGYTYSMGVNLGTRISERWVLQGGVNYLTQQSEYTANNVVLASTSHSTQRFLPATSGNVIHADEAELANKLAYSAPYNVNNSMRYLSIPMQAGYLLINKTFGLQLNAGVATDLFLQNTIEADSYQLEKTSQSGGPDSPYRTVNLSGLLGTEVSYRFGDNYRISLNPGIRYPFNSIYKSELGVQSTPLTFDIGLRFRYIFH